MVPAGTVTVPVNVGDAIGAYVLLAPAVVKRVPLVGSVKDVAPVVAKVNELEPDVTNGPPSVKVALLATPVPPFDGVSGFCNVTELNVGDGYVCANTANGNKKAMKASSFFMR